MQTGFTSLVTCGGSDGGFGRVQTVTVDGLGATPPLLGAAGGSGFDDGVHGLHQFQLLPPQILLLDELSPGLVFLLPDSLLLCFQSDVDQQTSIVNIENGSSFSPNSISESALLVQDNRKRCYISPDIFRRK